MAGKRQAELIDYLVSSLKNNEAVRALYLKGSLSDDSDDDYSDVDFYCIVKASAYETFMATRTDLLEAYSQVLYQSHVNFKYPQVVAIYDNDLHLDFYVTSDVEKQGYKMKLLYDPEGLYKDYKTLKRQDNPKTLIKHINNIIYSYHELYIAIKRDDLLWTSRLISHILADMSLLLDQMYPSDRPVLHMKGVYKKLPQTIKDKMNLILEHLNPKDALFCTRLLIDLTEDLIKNQPEAIDTSYLTFMKKKFIKEVKIQSYTLEACHELYKIYEADPLMTEAEYTYNYDKVNDYYTNKTKDPHRQIFSIIIDSTVIGEIQLKYINDQEGHGTLSIILANDRYKNKGYGSQAEKYVLDYAFETLGLKKVYADTTVRNSRSKTVLDKLGFKAIKQENGMDYFVLECEDFSMTD